MTDYNPAFLAALGWDPFFEDHFNEIQIPGAIPCRVAYEFKYSCQLFTGDGELSGTMSGRLRYTIDDRPSVGDWVVAVPYPEGDQATIHAILPRRSKFSRKAAGAKAVEQVVAANIDTVFIVTALDGKDYNRRRMERYLTMAWRSGASPVIVMNKADLCDDPAYYRQDIETVATGVPIHIVSAAKKTGVGELLDYIGAGKTAAFLGSSGVGKSALINALFGSERQAIGDINWQDIRGRHTTTRRELIMLPEGGMVIDTPGMRELQMWGSEDDLGDTFEDIESIAEACRFGNCRHDSEPGCAVREALEKGELDAARYDNYLKLQKELKFTAIKEESSARQAEQIRWKQIAKVQKQYKKNKYKG